MITFIRSSVFDEWLWRLKDQTGKARILARLVSAGLGNFNDCRPVGGGVSEMRIHSGGDKGSQTRDIARAKTMADAFEESGE